VTRIGDGVYRVEIDGRAETVYVAGPAHDRWVFWDGRVFRGDFSPSSSRRKVEAAAGQLTLSAPMPATVVAISVKRGDRVSKNQVVMLLEAMKMELPIRAPHEGVVSDVHVREGQLVDADARLVELAP